LQGRIQVMRAVVVLHPARGQRPRQRLGKPKAHLVAADEIRIGAPLPPGAAAKRPLDAQVGGGTDEVDEAHAASLSRLGRTSPPPRRRAPKPVGPDQTGRRIRTSRTVRVAEFITREWVW